MSLPTAVATQVTAINTNLNKLVTDRERLISWFDDGLGDSVWNLLTAANRTAAKNALMANMQTAIDGLQAAKNALAGM